MILSSRFFRLAWSSALCAFLSGMGSAANAAPVPVRIAVAPFQAVTEAAQGGEARLASGPDIAKLLAGRLALRNLERLIVPSAWVAEPRFEPHAEQVRRWAHSAAVDTVVVGRVSAPDAFPRGADAKTQQVEIVIRSGHSGAELFRHQMDLALEDGRDPRSEAGWAAALDPLAAAILGDLGQDARLIEGSPDPELARTEGAPQPDVSARGSGRNNADDGFASKIDLPGFTSDAPIEINADEAEIQSRGEERRLIFQNNVRVKQANILLLSDRLEADYRKGESEPRQLIARGNVRIDQGGRKASCDKAVYQREAQRLICEGHAQLVQGCDIVRGESIEFDLAGDQARVRGAASIVIRPESGAGTPSSACAAEKGLM